MPPEGASDAAWRICFVVGMVAAPWLATLATGEVVAGLVVGIGTALGSGCTSGHGVCGMARLSTRSIIATLTFMATGVITVFIVRHLLGWGA